MSNFRVGDKVRVRADASELTDDSFIDAMKDTPGMAGTVRQVSQDLSVAVKFDNGDIWWYMAYSLEAA